MTGFSSALYPGRVTHRRLRPVEHALEYRVFSMLIDLDELPRLDGALRRFSRGRFNLFSFHDRDYGAAPTDDLASHMREMLRSHGIDASGPLRLLCYPRILGFAFNPLAVHYCHDASGAPSAIVYEVRNTFGGKHLYVIPVMDGGADGVIRQSADKLFHVSPFLDMDMRYHFRMKPPGAEVTVLIRETDADGVILHAAFHGARRALNDRALLEVFFRYPLMTLKVVLGIHWEAAKLMAKGLRLRPGATPDAPLTLVTAPARPGPFSATPTAPGAARA